MNLKNIFFLLVCCMPYAHGMLSRMQNNYVRRVTLQKVVEMQRRSTTTSTQSINEKTTETICRLVLAPIMSFTFAGAGCCIGGIIARSSGALLVPFNNKINPQKIENAGRTAGGLTGALIGAACGGGLVGVGAVTVLVAAIQRDEIISYFVPSYRPPLRTDF